MHVKATPSQVEGLAALSPSRATPAWASRDASDDAGSHQAVTVHTACAHSAHGEAVEEQQRLTGAQLHRALTEAEGKVRSHLISLENKVQHPPNAFSALVGSVAGLAGLTFAEHVLTQLYGWPETLIFVGSFGALSALLFGSPAAPLATPKHVIGGHLLSLSLALLVFWCGVPRVVAQVLTPSLAISAMVYFKIQHPPAGMNLV